MFLLLIEPRIHLLLYHMYLWGHRGQPARVIKQRLIIPLSGGWQVTLSAPCPVRVSRRAQADKRATIVESESAPIFVESWIVL